MKSLHALSFSLLNLVVFVSVNGPAEATPANAVYTNGHRILPEERIINGWRAKEGVIPWQAIIVMDDPYFCGGSIIDPEWILTAAHCVYGRTTFEVTVGTIYTLVTPIGTVEPDKKTVQAKAVFLHPSYTPSSKDNDIALIQLPEPLTFTRYVNSVLLPIPTSDFQNLIGKDVILSGWGRVEHDSSSASFILKYTSMTIIPDDECERQFHDSHMEQKICAGSSEGHGACHGDSGGPVVYAGSDNKVYQVGVISHGSSECNPRQPVVFARVTSFLDFINSTMKQEGGKSE